MSRSFGAVAAFYDYTYRLFRPVLFRMDPEAAHTLTLALLRHAPRSRPRSDPPELQASIFGLTFSNPLGLAAGLDKDGLVTAKWEALGFGFAEIGTVTPRPQSGNPRPRIWRLEQHRALVNSMGFPSDGMDPVASRLAEPDAKSRRMRLGVNLGPNRATSPERIPEDYAALTRQMAALADFLVINVSSPNTSGLRDFQAPERMRKVIETVRGAYAEIGINRPLLIKLAPDLERLMLGEICAAAVELELAGIVATNSSLDHAALGVASCLEGGLSGNPLKLRSRAIIAAIYQLTRGRVPIIGVGGILSAEDAYGHLRAGASLVELYTGLIYHGPGLVGRIKSGLLDLLRQDGFRSISEAVGRGT
ncbi:MAG: quinone-dependent dihydroorotate dehydrogenase [Deltaproteobacteria bacterium]|nr:quinone-dependent dihydroorotate dehydrogenase [Deltaproteobacteria bacterium]